MKRHHPASGLRIMFYNLPSHFLKASSLINVCMCKIVHSIQAFFLCFESTQQELRELKFVKTLLDRFFHNK